MILRRINYGRSDKCQQNLRIGDYRVVYRIVEQKVIVYVLAVCPRRDKEIYRAASG
ncbi:type II toxin-antitoxin system RelE family toxin [Desulfobacter sp.]|uniref:type II toxin-antitoxin system RelE family toxin n=1 Tax=Desulfobacter sp. TaxID=2294 RepID=UPI003D095B5A